MGTRADPEPSAGNARIAFADVDDTVETLWATVVGRNWYRLENTPFFYYGVSLGDVVEARWREEDLEEQDDEDDGVYGFPYFTRVVEKSGNRTLRLALARAGQEDFVPVFDLNSEKVAPIFARLEELGCRYEGFHPYLVAINVPPEADLDAVMAYLISTGLKWENGDPPEEEVPGRACYTLRLAERGEDQYGGSPRGVDGEHWPVCRDCHSPMTFVMLLHRHEQRLRLRRSDAVALFHCTGHGDERPRAAHSAVLLLSAEQLRREPGGLVGAGPLGHKQLRYARASEPNPWALGSHRLGDPYTNKLGGYARWLGEERTPLCSECGRAMALVAQICADLDPALHLGDRVGYLFLCPQEHEGRFIVSEDARSEAAG